MAVLKAITRVVQKVEIAVSAAVVALIFLLTTINIIMRYVFNSPLPWAEEIILYSFVWMGFLTVSYTLSKDRHVRFTLVMDRLPQKGRRVLMAVLDGLIAVAFIALAPSAIRCMQFLITTPALKIPEKYLYYIVPIGYALMVFHSVVNIVSRFHPEVVVEQEPFAEKQSS